MLTISQLAKKIGISRTSILYYERERLLLPKSRSENGYRWYGKDEIERLKKIMAYRSFGIPVAKLSSLLNKAPEDSQKQILLDQFNALEQGIQQLRLQQKAIVQFMGEPQPLEQNAVTKESWTQIMLDAGLTEEDMRSWHIEFEKTNPNGHQKFLVSLNIETDEVSAIRNWAKS
ncbi:MAG: MerR family transcriptional regulator [Oceanospirillaceae bacterium]